MQVSTKKCFHPKGYEGNVKIKQLLTMLILDKMKLSFVEFDFINWFDVNFLLKMR